MMKAEAEAKNIALEAERQDVRSEFSIPVYSEAARLVQKSVFSSHKSQPSRQPTSAELVRRALEQEDRA